MEKASCLLAELVAKGYGVDECIVFTRFCLGRWALLDQVKKTCEVCQHDFTTGIHPRSGQPAIKTDPRDIIHCVDG